MFLRICVFLCTVLAAYIGFKDKKIGITVWLFIAVAILFNPFIPVHLTREIWTGFNILVAVLFGYMVFNRCNVTGTN